MKNQKDEKRKALPGEKIKGHVGGHRRTLKPLVPDEERKRNRQFVVVDIETMKWTEFLVIGLYDGKECFYFEKLSEFLSFTFEHYDGYDVFAHFGGRFDFLFILGEIFCHPEYLVSSMVPRASGLLYFDVSFGPRSLSFRDSSALLPFGLRKLTESFGASHLKKEWDHSKTAGVTKELLHYLEYDLKGLYEVMEKFYSWPIIKKAGGCYTIAGQAMRIFRTYLERSVFSLSHGLDERLRPSYLGGRTEIFKLAFKGPGKLYCYDVNSLYPTVMKKHEYPIDFSHETYSYEKGKLAIYEAQVDVPRMQVPPLGIVRDGKYIFPTGHFSGMWTSCELEYAKTCGVKFDVKRGYVFKNGGRIFKDYVDDLYAIRARSKSGTVDNTIAKLLLNASYGRFGISLQKENIVLDDGGEGLKPLKEIRVNGRTFRLMTKEVELETFTHVAIATFVTSYARIYMHQLYMEAPEELYYTDTDSLFTTHQYKTGEGLGALKLEGVFSSACFLLPKTYAAKGDTLKIAMKGFDKKKIQHFTMEDFYACLEGDLKRMKIVQEPKFATFKTALKSGKFVGMTKESSRQLKAQYDKRIFRKDGANYETTAIHIQ